MTAPVTRRTHADEVEHEVRRRSGLGADATSNQDEKTLETTTTPEKRVAPDPRPGTRSAWETSQPIDGYGAPRVDRRDSAADAVVTLLATVVFGLGWALVELERADPGQDRYDAAVSVAWSSAEQPGERIERWGEVARQRSRR